MVAAVLYRHAVCLMTRIWMALLVVNVAWSLHLVVSYFLAWVACSGDDGRLTTLRHLATVVALGVTWPTQ